MIILIVAGGSGTRLWPLSVPDYPKHLLTITGDKSLLQNTLERATHMTSLDKIYISTEISHSDHVISQLPELAEDHIIIEPARRGTLACISNALQIISLQQSAEEPVAMIWADSHVRNVEGFVDTFKYAGELMQKYQRMVLVGIEPTHPNPKLGYIKKSDLVDDESFLYNVDSFKEKPDYQTALEFVESGDYLWNAGYFVASFKVFRDCLEKYADEHWTNQLKLLKDASGEAHTKIYLQYEETPIEYALYENMTGLMMVPGTFDWLDIGSFDDVHEVTPQDEQHNSSVGGKNVLLDNRSVYVRNEEDKPVAVVGLDNVAVINTKEGVLVIRKDLSQKVKDVVKQLKK
jgi:mannose-1-phosphate guanylyltransferase